MKYRLATWVNYVLVSIFFLGVGVYTWFDLTKWEDSDQPLKRMSRLEAALYEIGGKPLTVGVFVFAAGFCGILAMISYWQLKDARY